MMTKFIISAIHKILNTLILSQIKQCLLTVIWLKLFIFVEVNYNYPGSDWKKTVCRLLLLPDIDQNILNFLQYVLSHFKYGKKDYSFITITVL